MRTMTGNELINIRKNVLRLSQTGLADALGVNLSTVWRWEKEQMPISVRVAMAIEKLATDAAPERQSA